MTDKILSERYNIKFEELLQKERYFQIINAFSQSLMLAETENEIVWCVTDNAISKMNYQDCVIYLLDENSDKLIQRSAFGPKASGLHKIENPFIIEKGRGIVGSVFETGVGEIIKDTRQDKRYIQDDAFRLSEISIPILLDGKTVGVIDSEHADVGFFTSMDFDILTTIANMISAKIERVKINQKYKSELEKAVQSKTQELKQANQILQIKNDEKEVLIKEMHHRVKNNMQIIISLLNMHIKSATTEDERHVFKECSDRMYAIANVHGKVYFDKNFLKVNIKEFLFELTSELITTHHKTKEIDLELKIDLDEVSLDIAIPLGLIINEMISLTINNKFSCQKHVNVVIEMCQKKDYYTVSYTDEKNRYSLDDSPEFFGLHLVNILTEQLDAEMVILPTSLTLSIPNEH